MTKLDLFLDLTESLQGMGLAAPGEQPKYTAITGGVSCDIWRVDLRRGSVCVKRALPRLRVTQEWLVPIERIQSEIAWIRDAESSHPRLCPAY